MYDRGLATLLRCMARTFGRTARLDADDADLEQRQQLPPTTEAERKAREVQEAERAAKWNDDNDANRVGPYRLMQELGSGTYGSVRLARLGADGAYYAIKTQHSQRNEGVRFAVLRELDLLRKLTHPNIVPLHDVLVDEMQHKVHMVLELARGDLEWYAEETRWPQRVRQVRNIARQLLESLAHCHRHHVVHRDVKPTNVLVARDAHDDGPRRAATGSPLVYLCDFGLSKRLVGRRHTPDICTTQFKAPELLLASIRPWLDYGPAIDIWALGCVLIWFLSRGSPFPSETQHGSESSSSSSSAESDSGKSSDGDEVDEGSERQSPSRDESNDKHDTTGDAEENDDADGEDDDDDDKTNQKSGLPLARDRQLQVVRLMGRPAEDEALALGWDVGWCRPADDDKQRGIPSARRTAADLLGTMIGSRRLAQLDRRFLDLLSAMMTLHPERRITAERALAHPYFAGQASTSSPTTIPAIPGPFAQATVRPYMERTNGELTPLMRTMLLDWLFAVVRRFSLEHAVLFATVELVDRFLSVYHWTRPLPLERCRLQLVGICCLMLACKYQDLTVVDVNCYRHICANAYSVDEILSCELDVLRTIDYDLGRETLYSLLTPVTATLGARRSARAWKELWYIALDYAFVGVPYAKIADAVTNRQRGGGEGDDHDNDADGEVRALLDANRAARAALERILTVTPC